MISSIVRSLVLFIRSLFPSSYIGRAKRFGANLTNLDTYIRRFFAFSLEIVCFTLSDAFTARFYTSFGFFQLEFLLVHSFLHVFWLSYHIDFHCSLRFCDRELALQIIDQGLVFSFFDFGPLSPLRFGLSLVRLGSLKSAAQLEKERTSRLDVVLVNELICADRILTCKYEEFVYYREVMYDLTTEIKSP